MSGLKDIDSWRKVHLAVAEFVDAWRIIPRAVVVVFSYGVYGVTTWYMNLKPYILEGCVKAAESVPTECIVQAPTTQHTALLTAMFALAAAVFAFYSNNGRKWNGFSHWNTNESKTSESVYWREGEEKPVQDERKDADRQGRAVIENARGNGG